MDTPYVREYLEDREITAWFLLDLSPSVDFGTADTERLKRSVLVDFVTTLARLLTRHGNRVGAVFYGSRVERTIPARGGRRIQVLRLVNDLLRQPRLPKAPFTDLTPLLEAGQRSIKGRSLVFVISDFISAPGWERPLNLLTQRHEVLAVRLFDRREVELPDVGPLIMEDAETGEQLYVDTHDKGFRRRFREAADRREATLARCLQAIRGRRGLALDRRGSRPRHRPDGEASASGAGGRAVSFIWPPMLLLVLAIPLGVARYLVLERRRRRRVAGFGPRVGPGRGERDGPVAPGGLRRRIPAAFMLAGLTILVVALARPQSVVSVPRVEGTVILSFDVSGSMAADDLKPTRMEAAKAAARAFVERQPTSVLIGVVAFSDSGFSIQVPTDDQTLVLAAINRLAPERGTSIARGILTSLTTIAAADADPAAGYYTNRSPDPDARADARAGGDARAGRDRPADRRREQPAAGSAGGRRRPPPTAACGSTRSGSAARRGRPSRSRASRSTASWTSRCSARSRRSPTAPTTPPTTRRS